MIARLCLILGIALASQATLSWSQGATDRVVPLQDGGRIVVQADGVTRHYDARGDSVHMQSGEVMVAADGSRLMMRGDVLWREILREAASLYGRSLTPPGTQGRPNERKVELADGGMLVIKADGSMVHEGADGAAARMDDGTVMVAKDGSRILMKNGALWVAPGSLERPKP